MKTLKSTLTGYNAEKDINTIVEFANKKLDEFDEIFDEIDDVGENLFWDKENILYDLRDKLNKLRAEFNSLKRLDMGTGEEEEECTN